MLEVKNALMCDYAAMGANNKHILVHTYAGVVIVPDFPANLQCSFYLEVMTGRTGEFQLNFEIMVGDKVIGSVGVGLLVADEAADQPAVIVLPQLVVPIPEPSSIKVFGWGDDGERFLLLEKPVIQAPLAP